MIDNLINEIEQAMLNVLDNEQLIQLRKVLDYTFRNISVTKKISVARKATMPISPTLRKRLQSSSSWHIPRSPKQMHQIAAQFPQDNI